MKCSRCGAENSEDVRFCTACGAPLDASPVSGGGVGPKDGEAASDPSPAAPAPAPAASVAAPAASAEVVDKNRIIESPIVGTFYRSSSPGADPFVKVGSKVEPDTAVCIVEAMKVMNEIKAEKSGVIKELLVENGQPVEYGQPLFILE